MNTFFCSNGGVKSYEMAEKNGSCKPGEEKDDDNEATTAKPVRKSLYRSAKPMSDYDFMKNTNKRSK